VKAHQRQSPRTRPAKPAREAPPQAAQGIARLVGNRAHTGSKLQQRFARLIKQIDQRKRRLRTWYDQRPAIHSELAAGHAALDAVRRTGHDLVCQWDRLYHHPSLGKPERKSLRALICEVASDLLCGEGFDDLKPIYNRHSRRDFDTEAAIDDAATAQMMRTVMEEMFGMDFGDADVSSTAKLHAHTEAQLHTLEQEQEQAGERRAQRKKSPRRAADEARREAEKVKIGKVLQDVYRKLALALHPDLERDPVERARKHELMQQVNIAHEASDLLRLLELQLELEQIDPDHASEVAEDRLRHYNAILDQQLKQLNAELDDLEMPWRVELGMAQVSPPLLLARLQSDLADLRSEGAALRRDLESCQDATGLKAWLGHRARRRRESRQQDLFG
jgi:hypothetical protein